MYVDLVGCETTLRVAADISPIAVVRLDQLSLSRHFTAPSLKLSQNTCSHKPCQYCLECIERATRASAAPEIRAIRRGQRWWLRRKAAEDVWIATGSGDGGRRGDRLSRKHIRSQVSSSV